MSGSAAATCQTFPLKVMAWFCPCIGECSFQLFGRDLARDCKVDFTDFSCVVRLATQGRWSVALSIYSYFNRFHLQVGKLWCDTCGSWCLQKTLWRDGPGKWNMGAFTRFQRVHTAFNLPQTCGLRMRPCKRFVVVSEWTSCTLRPHIYIFNKHACSSLMTSDIPTSCFTIDLASPPCQTKEFVVAGLGFLVQGMEAEINVGCLRYPLSFTTGRWVLGLGDVVIIVKLWCYQIHAFWLVVHVPFASFCTCLSRNPSHFSPGFSGRWENTHANTTILVVAKQSTQLRRYFTWAYLDVCPTMFVLYSNGIIQSCNDEANLNLRLSYLVNPINV